MSRRLIAIEADWHSNNRFGLMQPETILESQGANGGVEEFSPELAPVQQFLYELRSQNIEKLKELAGDDEIVFFHLGDPAQGFKHNGQFVQNTEYDEISIAFANAKPIFSLPNVTTGRFVVGTEAHEGIGGSATKILSRMLHAEFPDADIKYIYHGFANVDGITIDYTHHGPTTGIRKWTEGNQLGHYLKDILITDLLDGKTPARYYFRGHVHRLGWETRRVRRDGEWITGDIIVVPSMCDMGAFARQITRSENRITNGMVVLEIIDGKLLDIHWFVVTRDLRSRETI
jgi:hypothetical protein